MSHLFTEINVRKKLAFQQKNSCNSEYKFLIHLPGKSCGVNSRQWSQFCSKLLLLAAKQWQGGKAWACCVLQISHLVQEKLRLWTQYREIFLRFLIPFPVVLCVTAHIKKIQCNCIGDEWGERVACCALTRASDSTMLSPFPQLQLWQDPALCCLH